MIDTDRLSQIAAELGRVGGKARAASLSASERQKIGKAGGVARARSMTRERRAEIARAASAARWGSKRGKKKTPK